MFSHFLESSRELGKVHTDNDGLKVYAEKHASDADSWHKGYDLKEICFHFCRPVETDPNRLRHSKEGRKCTAVGFFVEGVGGVGLVGEMVFIMV